MLLCLCQVSNWQHQRDATHRDELEALRERAIEQDRWEHAGFARIDERRLVSKGRRGRSHSELKPKKGKDDLASAMVATARTVGARLATSSYLYLGFTQLLLTF